MRVERWRLGLVAAGAGALFWATPFAWMLVASLREGLPADIASLTPSGPFSLGNFASAWQSGPFLVWYVNTLLMCFGILGVQLVTITLAGYAFARLEFPGRELVFAGFLAQLLLIPPLLIEPNLTTLARLGLYDSLIGVMAPYVASAFGVFLMRQTFRSIPIDFEEAARLDGAGPLAIVWHVLAPMARPAFGAFAIVSITAHWNEFLWPLIVLSSPRNQVLTVGLASFASGAEAGSDWGTLAAGTLMVGAPLLIVFAVFQRQFIAGLTAGGLK